MWGPCCAASNPTELSLVRREHSMPPSPIAIYQTHLDRGELAYQWSPQAGRAVFYPRLVCPYSGSTVLEWRGASGLRTRLGPNATPPPPGETLHLAPTHCRESAPLVRRGPGNRPTRR